MTRSRPTPAWARSGSQPTRRRGVSIRVSIRDSTSAPPSCAAAGSARTEVQSLAETFRGRIVDVAADTVIVEIAGTEKKLEGFVELMRPLGILELVRTGRIAMVRGSPPTRELTESADGARPADSASSRDSFA